MHNSACRVAGLGGCGQFSNGVDRMCSMPVVYKVTYPNGKIYVGCDMTDNVRYFGSANPELVAADLTPEQKLDLAVRKQILWGSATASLPELLQKERDTSV